LLVLVECHDEGSVEPIMAKQFEFLSVVIACEGLLRTLHVEDMQEQFRMRVVAVSIEGCSIDGEVRRRLRLEVRLVDVLPDAFVSEEDLLQVVLVTGGSFQLEFIGLIVGKILVLVLSAARNYCHSQVVWLIQLLRMSILVVLRQGVRVTSSRLGVLGLLLVVSHLHGHVARIHLLIRELVSAGMHLTVGILILLVFVI